MKRLPVSLVAIVSVLLGCGLVYAAGIRLNTTPSIPLGIYQMTTKPLSIGDYVLFCPPNTAVFRMAKERGYLGAGFCPGGFGPMLKKLVAVQDDLVVISADGVLVNGKLLPMSTPIKADDGGRALPHFARSWILGSTEVLVMSDSNPDSFDGRYFGTIDHSQIQGVIRPLITW